MRTLQQAIEKVDNKGGAADSLRKHLTAAGITSWRDIDRASLYELRDELSSLAPSTARTVSARAKTLLNRYQDVIKNLPEDWRKILTFKNVLPRKVFLTEEELGKVELSPAPHTDKQRYARNLFLICAWTGLRVSDARRLTPASIKDGYIHYIAQKTKKAGAVPCKKGLETRIDWIAKHSDLTMTLAGYNAAVRLICKGAGIDEQVTVLKGGKEVTGPKWQFVSSHTARISTASCLNKRGVGIDTISRLLQHSSTETTRRYIVRENIDLPEQAMAFFG